MTEQTGETGEIINKFPTHTPSCTSAKSLTGSETLCFSLGLGRVVGSHMGRRAHREPSASLQGATCVHHRSCSWRRGG